MIRYNPDELPLPLLANLLTDTVGPRPIALASTIDSEGKPNLSPFSFFNAFGTNPPVLIFSPARRGRDNTTKHTYENLKQVPEVVINVVTYSMVQQVVLASSDFPHGVSEFEKAGLTMQKSDVVRPARVAESPVQFECTVMQIVETGHQAGAGNLVICKIVAIHVNELVLDEKGWIDPHKIDLVGRLGRNYYCRASGEAVFEIGKPLTVPGIGVDALPLSVRHSKFLTGNNLGQLGNLKSLPSEQVLNEAATIPEVMMIFKRHSAPHHIEEALHRLARLKIESGDVDTALAILLLSP